MVRLSSTHGTGSNASAQKVFFIDGQFFKTLCSGYSEDIGVDIFSALRWDSLRSGAHRVFYYDSLPARKNSQREEDYRSVLEAKIVELDHIRGQNCYQVKDGLSRYRSGKKNRGLEQKGVDILLALDAFRFASIGVADEIHIFTSDADFYPVFEALQQTPCRGILRYQFGKPSQELIYAADIASFITVSELLAWCGMGPDTADGTHVFPKPKRDYGSSDRRQLKKISSKSRGEASIDFDPKMQMFAFSYADDKGQAVVRHTPSPLIAIEMARRAGYDVNYGHASELRQRAFNI